MNQIKIITILVSILIASNAIWFSVVAYKNNRITGLLGIIQEIANSEKKISEAFIKNNKIAKVQLIKNQQLADKILKVNLQAESDYKARLQKINDALQLANQQTIACEQGVSNFGEAFNKTLALKEQKDIEIKEDLDNE